jgi:antitoxin FitA
MQFLPRLTCDPHVSKLIDMSKMIQLRNVPDQLHRKLKARAAIEGRSLSDYLLEEIRRAADRPTLTELAERLQHRARTTPEPSPEEAVRAERDRH